MNLEVIFEMLEYPHICKRSSSVAMKEHYMRQMRISGRVDLVNVIVLINGNISELELDMNFKIGELQSLMINFEKILSHYHMVTFSRHFFFYSYFSKTFLLHLFIFIFGLAYSYN